MSDNKGAIGSDFQIYPIPAMTLQERFAWVGAAPNGSDLHRRRALLLAAQTAIGQNGSVEDKLLRLMVWVGAKLYSAEKHSKTIDPFEILLSGDAWCDQQTKVFMFLAFHLLGVNSREIAVKHTDEHNGHAVVEVFYDEEFHLFDVHTEHQAVYRDPVDGHILSWDELCLHRDVVDAECHWWKGSNGEGKSGFYTTGYPATKYFLTHCQGYMALDPDTLHCPYNFSQGTKI